MIRRQTQKPVVKITRLLSDLRQSPSFVLSQLKKMETRGLTLVAVVLAKRYDTQKDGDEQREAIKVLISYIWALVKERVKK